jgi:cell division transport system permease protein
MITFKRIIKSGLKSFWRNGWLSVATISIMILTLLVIGTLLMLNVIASAVLLNLQEKIDISVYFKLEANEEDILVVKSQLEKLVEVERVEYVSRDDALERFRERHKDNPYLIQSLQELGENPLEASLNIKAQEASQYETISTFLEGIYYNNIIDKVDYRQNKEVIDRLSNLIANVKLGGLILSGIMILIVLLVTFNAIRLAIYSSRGEIKIMRLVGANNWFIRGPFIVEGILYGIISSLFTIGVLYPVFYFISPKISGFLPIEDFFVYFQANVWAFLVLLLVIGVGLGAISSFIAIRKYLKV